MKKKIVSITLTCMGLLCIFGLNRIQVKAGNNKTTWYSFSSYEYGENAKDVSEFAWKETSSSFVNDCDRYDYE